MKIAYSNGAAKVSYGILKRKEFVLGAPHASPRLNNMRTWQVKRLAGKLEKLDFEGKMPILEGVRANISLREKIRHDGSVCTVSDSLGSAVGLTTLRRGQIVEFKVDRETASQPKLSRMNLWEIVLEKNAANGLKNTAKAVIKAREKKEERLLTAAILGAGILVSALELAFKPIFAIVPEPAWIGRFFDLSVIMIGTYALWCLRDIFRMHRHIVRTFKRRPDMFDKWMDMQMGGR
ncbi:MAG: hypothetical protein WC861_00960 [Candidatus Micrarchaeia archaeon]|jgi:hypothetical protein